MMLVNAPACEAMTTESSLISMASSGQSVVFRTTQKLRSNDGREIYFYSSRKCEGYYKDRLEFSCEYRIQDDEVRLLDEDGNTVYKGSCTWRVKGQSLSSVSIAGTRYYAR